MTIEDDESIDGVAISLPVEGAGEKSDRLPNLAPGALLVLLIGASE